MSEVATKGNYFVNFIVLFTKFASFVYEMGRPKKYNGETEVVSFRVPKTMTDRVRKAVDNILNPKVPPPPLGIGNPVADKANADEWRKQATEELNRLQKEIANPPKGISVPMKVWYKVREDRIKELNKLI